MKVNISLNNFISNNKGFLQLSKEERRDLVGDNNNFEKIKCQINEIIGKKINRILENGEQIKDKRNYKKKLKLLVSKGIILSEGNLLELEYVLDKINLSELKDKIELLNDIGIIKSNDIIKLEYILGDTTLSDFKNKINLLKRNNISNKFNIMQLNFILPSTSYELLKFFIEEKGITDINHLLSLKNIFIPKNIKIDDIQTIEKNGKNEILGEIYLNDIKKKLKIFEENKFITNKSDIIELKELLLFNIDDINIYFSNIENNKKPSFKGFIKYFFESNSKKMKNIKNKERIDNIKKINLLQYLKLQNKIEGLKINTTNRDLVLYFRREGIYDEEFIVLFSIIDQYLKAGFSKVFNNLKIVSRERGDYPKKLENFGHVEYMDVIGDDFLNTCSLYSNTIHPCHGRAYEKKWMNTSIHIIGSKNYHKVDNNGNIEYLGEEKRIGTNKNFVPLDIKYDKIYKFDNINDMFFDISNVTYELLRGIRILEDRMIKQLGI